MGGMLHYMLPDPSLSPDKAKANPAMFADTEIPRLFRAAYELGAVKKNVIVKIAAGSQLLDDNGTFNIGKPFQPEQLRDVLIPLLGVMQKAGLQDSNADDDLF